MPQKVIITELPDDERQEIENLFERINSLESLSLTLAADNKLFKENSDMYERIITDLTDTRKKFNQWWLFLADKYNLDKDHLSQYHVDFQDSNLFSYDEAAG